MRALRLKAASGKRAGVLHNLPFKYRVVLIAISSLTICAAAGFGAMLVYYTVAFPNPLAISAKPSTPLVRVLARDGSLLGERGGGQDYIPIDLLPPHLINAVVATEDRRFFEHWGLDPAGMMRAFFANMRAGRFAQGGSTLTQQLAKNLFLSSDRTIARKVEELALAFWLEIRLTKQEILELYLNRVYFGGGAYGIESASKRYFGKSSRDLTINQSAIIAGLLKAPTRYSPANNPDAARNRARVVLANMTDAGFLTPEQELKAARERVAFAIEPGQRQMNAQGYAVDYIADVMPALLPKSELANLSQETFVVETTFDAALQRRAGDIVARHLKSHGQEADAGQAAVTLLNRDGALLAMIGGRSYAETQYNRAFKARRQPGSAFKPFVYLAAVESGSAPDTLADDVPLNVAGWTPRNDHGTYAGEITLRRALAQSINTIAVKLYLEAGPGRVASLAHRLGIKSDLRDDASLALGTSEVSLLDLTGSYATFANDGIAAEPYAIRRVRTSAGRTVFERRAAPARRLVDASDVEAMNDMLSSVIVAGTGKRAALPRHEAAGKTGTTQEFKDAWFVGYTGQLSAGVWVGNDDGHPMKRVTGGSIPAEIWHDVMTVAHEGLPSVSLPGADVSERDTILLRTVSAANRQSVAGVDEDLPWLENERPKTRWALPSYLGAGFAEGRQREVYSASYPPESISEDFVSGVLDERPRRPRARGWWDAVISAGGW